MWTHLHMDTLIPLHVGLTLSTGTPRLIRNHIEHYPRQTDVWPYQTCGVPSHRLSETSGSVTTASFFMCERSERYPLNYGQRKRNLRFRL